MNNQLVALALFCLVGGVFGDGVERVGKPDNNAKIERPCKTYDLNCIRGFFQSHGQCKKSFGPVPDPLTRPQSNIYFPRTNMTVSIVDQKIGGLNGMIEEFYINRETDKLVIAVEFRNVSQTSDKTFYIFHRRAREPIVTVARYIVFYDRFTVTAVIPKIDELQLNDAEFTTFYNGQTTRFAVTPDIILTQNTGADPQPAAAVALAFTNVPVDIQELFLTESAYLISTYIQYNICDFGLLLT